MFRYLKGVWEEGDYFSFFGFCVLLGLAVVVLAALLMPAAAFAQLVFQGA